MQEVEDMMHISAEVFRQGTGLLWSEAYEVLEAVAEKALVTTPE